VRDSVLRDRVLVFTDCVDFVRKKMNAHHIVAAIVWLTYFGIFNNKSVNRHAKQIRNISNVRVALGGLVVSVLATGPKVRGFDPDKNPEHHFLRRESKAVGPMP
jgi:hypothetical protein